MDATTEAIVRKNRSIRNSHRLLAVQAYSSDQLRNAWDAIQTTLQEKIDTGAFEFATEAGKRIVSVSELRESVCDWSNYSIL